MESKQFLVALVVFPWFHWLLTFPLSLLPFRGGGNREGTSARVALLGSGKVEIQTQALDHHAYYCLTRKRNAVAEKDKLEREKRENESWGRHVVETRDCHQRPLWGVMPSVLLLLQDVNNPWESQCTQLMAVVYTVGVYPNACSPHWSQRD